MSRTWDRLLLLACALAIFAAVVVGALVQSRWPERLRQLVDANPAWEVARAPNRFLALTERSSGARLLMSEDEAGPYALTRVPCADMEKRAPPWFRTPPDSDDTPALACVRLGAPGREVYLANFRTTLEVPEIWKDFFEPLTRDYSYGSSGGGSTTDSRRFDNFVSYSVSPQAANDTRETQVAAFYVEGKATVVVAFRDVVR